MNTARKICSTALLSLKVNRSNFRTSALCSDFITRTQIQKTPLRIVPRCTIAGVTGVQNTESRRYYNRKKTIKIPPTKTLNFDYSGDLTYNELPLELSGPRNGFENLQELEEASDVVKKIFSLEFGDSQDLLQKRLTELTKWVKEHPTDVKSLEFKVAMYTVQIRNQIKHCMQFRKDKLSKGILITRIQRRKKALKLLRKMDYEKFEWLLKELKIKYVPLPKYNFPISKRAARKRAAADKALGIKREKMEQLKKKLEAERAAFDEIKAIKLAEIEKEMKTLGIEKGETLSDTIEILKFGKVLEKKREVPKKRREILLQMKFELYKNKYPPKYP